MERTPAELVEAGVRPRINYWTLANFFGAGEKLPITHYHKLRKAARAA